MLATIINGKEIAEQMQVELAEKVNAFLPGVWSMLRGWR